MEPEIARRCSACGASVRGGSFFCPQCGEALKSGAARAGAAGEELPESPARRKTDAGAVQSQTSEAASTVSTDAHAQGLAPGVEAPLSGAVVESRPRARIIPADAADLDDGTRSKRQRLAGAARERVEEKLAPRVEKLRQASNVMLEEAAYDPSLRFVLVVVALVLLSLLILLLNYLLG